MSTHTAPPAPSFAQSTWLVAERELGSKLRSKAFVAAGSLRHRARTRSIGRTRRATPSTL